MVKRTNNRLFTPYLVLILISLFLIAGEKIGISRIFRFPLEVVLVPPQRILSLMKIQFTTNFKLIFTRDLQNKLIQSDDYKMELDVLKSKIQLLEEENNTLRKQLESPLPPQWQFIPAHVLGRERFLLIDKGKRDGVAKDMPVISENILLGKIAYVSEKTSQAMLLWDPDSKIPVTTDKNVKGLLTGVFGNQINLTRILQREKVNVLDTVSTSGEEEGFPAHLLIGKIEEIIVKEENVYKEAKVTPLIDYDKIQNVFIISAY